jgi:hypothetical protein
VTSAQGVPATTQSYVDLVAGYAAWYALQPEFGGPADGVPSATAGTTARTTAQPVAASAADAVPVPAALVAPILAAGSIFPAVTPARIAAQLMAMSGFNEKLVGSNGAQGIAQFRPEVWSRYAAPPTASPLDAKAAIGALGRAMCDLSTKATGGTADPYSVALAAFQFGSDVVAQSGGVPGSDNVQALILRVLVYAEHYRGDTRLAPKPASTAPPSASAPPPSGQPTTTAGSLPAPGATPARQGRLVSDDSSKCATATAATDGSKLAIQPCTSSSVQQWTLMSDNTIRTGGLCMDLSGGSTANLTRIQIAACDGSPAQQFKLNATDDLVALMVIKCVDVLDGKPDDGQPLVLWPCTGTANQTWRLQ